MTHFSGRSILITHSHVFFMFSSNTLESIRIVLLGNLYWISWVSVREVQIRQRHRKWVLTSDYERFTSPCTNQKMTCLCTNKNAKSYARCDCHVGSLHVQHLLEHVIWYLHLHASVKGFQILYVTRVHNVPVCCVTSLEQNSTVLWYPFDLQDFTILQDPVSSLLREPRLEVRTPDNAMS